MLLVVSWPSVWVGALGVCGSCGGVCVVSASWGVRQMRWCQANGGVWLCKTLCNEQLGAGWNEVSIGLDVAVRRRAKTSPETLAAVCYTFALAERSAHCESLPRGAQLSAQNHTDSIPLSALLPQDHHNKLTLRSTCAASLSPIQAVCSA